MGTATLTTHDRQIKTTRHVQFSILLDNICGHTIFVSTWRYVEIVCKRVYFLCFQINLIYVVFDEPVTVSMIKVWNYSKTPIRGVQQFGVTIKNMWLEQFSNECPKTKTSNPHSGQSQRTQTIQ